MKDDEIKVIDIENLEPFLNHPFKVRHDEELAQIAESIRENGLIIPALARPKNGGYELISGHRRMEACMMLGIKTMPVIVREMTDEDAIISMVDSNLQRENILPSEKAFSYKMRLEAMKKKGAQVGHPKKSRDILADEMDVSREQVRRYIRLTYLIPSILDMVDEKKMAFNPAVELSYLSKTEQQNLYLTMQSEDRTPSLSQAQQMKKLSLLEQLDMDKIFSILQEPKPNQQELYRFKRDEIRKYFPATYTDKQIHDAVFSALELLKRQRERSKYSR